MVVALALGGCTSPTSWCERTWYFTTPDSAEALDLEAALTDTTLVGLEPDSVNTVWPVDGRCPE